MRRSLSISVTLYLSTGCSEDEEEEVEEEVDDGRKTDSRMPPPIPDGCI